MKKNILKIAISAMALLFAMSLALIPGKRVNADKETTIATGQTVAVDFEADSTWWYKFSTAQSLMFEIESTGSIPVKVELYKNMSDSSCIESDSFSVGVNFDLIRYVDAGTYYFKVTPTSEYIDISPNDTKVTLKDISNTTLVAVINETNFPDAEFRSRVSQYDLRPDGKLTQDEISLVLGMNFSGNSISDLKGIEFFSELRYLSVYNNSSITSLVLANPKLVEVEFHDNKNLASLDFSGCKELYYVGCYANALTSLDLTKNNQLSYLSCYKNKLQSLNLSKNSLLSYLNCSNNLLTKLDLSNNKSMRDLYCYSNQLTELNISGCKNIESIYCDDNELTALDVSKCSALDRLDCYNNQIESLKINDDIVYLDCHNNKLSSLDISACTGLTYLDCTENSITALNISNCTWIMAIYDDNHKQAEGSYSGMLAGTYCVFKFDPSKVTVTVDTASDEQVVELNGTNFPDSYFLNMMKEYDANNDGWLGKKEISGIKSLSVYSNIKTSKGIEYLTKLKKLSVYFVPLTDLDLSKNTELTQIECRGCEIENLDLSKNTKLVSLMCVGNKLTKLDVSNCPNLENLMCYDNELTSLDLSKNPKIEALGCFGNNITELDISNCEALVNAYKNGEYLDSDYTLNGGKKIKIAEYYSSDGGLLGVDPTTTIKADKPTPTPTATPTATPAPTTAPTGAPTAAPTGAAADVTLKIDKETANVVCGKTLTLKATLTGSSEKISWKTSDKKIATVDANGKISAKMAGAVTVTASAAGKSVECKVTVLYKDVTKSKDFWFAPTNYLTAKGVVKGYDNQTKFKPANKCTRAQMVTFIWRLMGEPAPKAKTCKFKDVKKTDYFYKACIWGNEKKIVEGYKDGTFGPQIVCARRHAVTFLWRLAGKPAPKTTKNPFKDVKKSDYFYKATLWASAQKILAGYSDGTFKPNGVCLRRQMVTFLWRLAGKPAPKTTKNPFKDVKKSDYFYKATLWASEKKILAGYSDGTFKPNGDCLRRQMVTFLYKYDKYINGKG